MWETISFTVHSQLLYQASEHLKIIFLNITISTPVCVCLIHKQMELINMFYCWLIVYQISFLLILSDGYLYTTSIIISNVTTKNTSNGMMRMLTSKVQKRDSGQLTITIPKDFAIINKIDKGVVFEFISDKDTILERGDIILKRRSQWDSTCQNAMILLTEESTLLNS